MPDLRRPAISGPSVVAAALTLLTELTLNVVKVKPVVAAGRRKGGRQLPVAHPGEHGGADDPQG